jgi:predicted Holliday junction resolvase-like endonuclease
VCKAVNGITLAILAADGTVIVALAITVVILLIQRRHGRSENIDLAAEVQDLRAREQASRDDAVRRSRSTILGDVAQHFAPLLPGFPYNHRDFRWMGGVLDGVVFDGLEAGADVTIVFLDIKTGSATLSKRQRRVRDAAEAGRVKVIACPLPGAVPALEAPGVPELLCPDQDPPWDEAGPLAPDGP